MRNGKKPTRKQKIRLGKAGLAPENWLVIKQKVNGELEAHLRNQRRQEREMREILDSMTKPYELRGEEGGRPSEAVGMIDLTIKATRSAKIVMLPQDKEFRQEAAAISKAKKNGAGDEFLGKKADDALARLRAMNE